MNPEDPKLKTCSDWQKKIEQFIDIDSKQPKGHENKSDVYTELKNLVYGHTDDCVACADFELNLRCRQEKIVIDKFPCVHVAYYSSVLCEAHENGWDCTDVSLVYDENGEWGLPVRDQEDGSAETMIRVRYCPWCSVKLTPAPPKDNYFRLDEPDEGDR